MKKFWAVLIFNCLCFLLIAENVQSEVVGLNPIIITSHSSFKGVSKYDIPYKVNVFSANDIEKSGAETLLGFLRKVGGINVSDWYGTGVKASVDMMGFGETASSNLLLLINGKRANDIDMSGIDWTQVSIRNIERIEVLKGGGTVLYGDNAAGGVINIITKKPFSEKLSGSLEVKLGSYSSDLESLEVQQKTDKLSLYLNAAHSGTNGYRKNSHYFSDNLSTYLEFNFQENSAVFLDLGYHRYRYGLPGALYDTDIGNGYSRTDTKYPDDHACMEDSYYNAGFEHSFNDTDRLLFKAGFRNKNGKDNWDGSGYNIDRNIQNRDLRIEFLKNFYLGGLSNDLIAGLDFYRADFSADKDYYNETFWSTDDWTDIDRSTRSIFMQNEVRLNDKLSILLGARHQKEEFTFDYISRSGAYAAVDDDINFNKEAYEAGINYLLKEKANIFLHFARGFRVPKTDEYFSVWASPPVNKNLLAQNSKTITGGFNSQINEKTNFDFNIFYMNADNELYYDPTLYSNVNYEGTERLGFNVNFGCIISEKLLLNWFYAYLDAQYREGSYKDKIIPMVPKHSLKSNLSYFLSDNLSFYADFIYRGSVYQINDPGNIYKKGDSYWVTNIKIDYKCKDDWIFYM
ncbi:MAG: TonB-dependent receptor, partial [Candidatus Omnitrophica bacterium]|nr:TonB-dependent receptor [Candidatus Omnitrophota bacterium]